MKLQEAYITFNERGEMALSESQIISLATQVDHGKISMAVTSMGWQNFNRASVSELTYYGLTEKEATRIRAAFLIEKRTALRMDSLLKLSNSQDVAKKLSYMRDYDQEVFVVVFLNRSNRLLKIEEIFKGGMSSTLIDPRIVMQKALFNKASAMIIAHNHPSGNLNPSQPDINMTNKLKSACELFDIQLLDHLIISKKGHYSFAEEGLL